MTDWRRVAFDGLAIFGASIVVAAYSYYHWRIAETGRGHRDLFRDPAWRLSSSVGLMIMSAGWMLGQAHTRRAQAVCGLLTLVFAWLAFDSKRRRRQDGRDDATGGKS